MKRTITSLLLLTSAFLASLAQTTHRMYDYDFKAALVECNDSLALGRDSSIFLTGRQNAENGIEMAKFCHKPKVVARKLFNADDFFLFYPLANKIWHRTQYQGTYICAPGEVQDTVIRPQSDSLEFFSFVCGNEKYFSSKELSGVGGYDLYVSRWDEKKKTWGSPTNLGFPYSSPYDDFLFVNTEDGKYSIFASNRDCPQDSVYVYVVEYDPVMLRADISEPSELKALCSMPVSGKVGMESNSSSGSISSVPDESTRKYIDKIAHIRLLRDTISINAKRLESLRRSYSASSANAKPDLARKIADEEQKETILQGRMEKETAALRNIEMDFLMNGVAIDIDKLIAESNKVVAVSETGFTFTRQEFGTPVILKYIK